MFELNGVTKRYGAVTALDNVTVTLPARRTTVLLGTSGSGKTTLLRTLNGLVIPDAGTVRFDGTIVDADHARALRRRMGYVVQGGGLFPHLTARDNVTLLARELAWSSERIAQRLEELGTMVQLPPSAVARYPAELSGGQAQRVSLMRALMLDPDVVLLDEALGALDPLTRRALRRDLRALFGRLGKTVVLVTHDLEEARFFAELLVVMREGRIEQAAPVDEVTTRPATPFVAELMSPAEAAL